MERIFANSLKKQLTQRIKCNLSVHVINDTLIVDINSVGYRTFHYTINNLVSQISKGLSTKTVADVIVKQYKNHILKQYFR